MTDSFNTLRTLAFGFATLMLIKYFVFLILAPFYNVQEFWRKKVIRAKNNKNKWEPRVSVVIPAWNEEVGIGKSIESLLAQTYKNLQIIVVNDGSTDKTEAVVAKYKDERITYIAKENGGKGSALNAGIAKASGEVVVTMDADSAFRNDAIGNLVEYFKDDSIDGVVGNVKVAGGAGLLGYIQQLEYLFGFYFKRTHAITGSEYIFGGACAAFRKATTFGEVGLFDTQNKTEDIEMSMRLRFLGKKCTFAEDVVAYTEGAGTITGLINQRLRWKKGRFDTFLKYRRMFFSLDRNHNKFLAWFVLPFSMLAELQLVFEPIALTLLIVYSFVSGDYLSLALGSLFIFVIYLVNALFGGDGVKPRLLFVFFFTWPLFYFLVWVEYLALLRSISLIVRGEDIVWQKWERSGIGA